MRDGYKSGDVLALFFPPGRWQTLIRTMVVAPRDAHAVGLRTLVTTQSSTPRELIHDAALAQPACLSNCSSRVVFTYDLQLGWCFHCIMVVQLLSASGAAAYGRPAPR